MSDAPAPHQPAVCPHCGLDITGFAGLECPVCRIKSKLLPVDQTRRAGPARPGFWRDGAVHFGIVLSVSLCSPIVSLLISLPFRSLQPLATIVPLIALGVLGLHMAGTGSRHHFLSRLAVAAFAWLIGVLPLVALAYFVLKASAGVMP